MYYISYFVKIMNQKNSLGLDICFKDLNNPIELFKEWFEEAKKSEPKDPNALALATSDKKGTPSVRIVLLKDYSEKGFVFYTNMNSAKSKAIIENPISSMCFYWNSLDRQIRITGNITNVSDEEADKYFNSRPYGSKIGAWASNQSSVLNSREEIYQYFEDYKIRYSNQKKVPRPKHWSGWNLDPNEIEFWLRKDNRVHERLKYQKEKNGNWNKSLLSP